MFDHKLLNIYDSSQIPANDPNNIKFQIEKYAIVFDWRDATGGDGKERYVMQTKMFDKVRNCYF